MFKLEQTLELHSSDIKDIAFGPNFRATCSRDSTIKVFYNNELYVLCPYRGYVNCIAMTPSLGLYAGCQDSAIVFYRSYNAEPVYMTEHTSNVCALDYRTRLLSGSWDHTLKEWDAGNSVFSFAHPASVWACKYISDSSFASACADSKVRIFESGALKAELQYHLHCVRSLWVHNDIYSVSNEGLAIQIGVDGGMIKYADHNSFMYSICVDDRLTVLAGDNGTIVVNDAVLRFPVSTFWKVVIYDEKVYAAGSDGKIYVLCRKEEGGKGAGESPCKTATAKDNIASHGREEGKEERSSQEGFQNQRKKVVNGKVYTLVNNEWVLLGDVVEKFEHTFNVDVEGRSLELSFNDNENVFDVADRFLKHHKLNEQYRNEIVEFINKNFKKEKPYYKYDNINYEGVKKILDKYQSKAILENLENPSAENSKAVEKNIGELMKIPERFVLLDCYRYFVAKGLKLDFAFLTRLVPRDRKEALVFIKLVTNLYAKQPFNLECLRQQVLEIRDRRLASEEVLDKYENNRELSRK